MSYIEKIHDQDWREGKKDYSFFEKEARFEIVKNLILSKQPNIVLDVGCGSGYLAFLLEQENPRIFVHGFDVSLEALKLATSLNKKYKLDINYQNIPENDNSYDIVVCSEVLEHLINVRHCLMEINRVLKDQGKLIVTAPNFSFWRFRIDSLTGRVPYVVSDERHIQTFNKELLTKRLNEAGFNVLQLIGTRVRLKFLLRISVSFFSETLIVLASKSKPRA
jgi:2-polyprenyl-6-hydroxyphenyl methylase/3-demethylubiquinone-9 3-methyltransferase